MDKVQQQTALCTKSSTAKKRGVVSFHDRYSRLASGRDRDGPGKIGIWEEGDWRCTYITDVVLRTNISLGEDLRDLFTFWKVSGSITEQWNG